MRYWHLKITAVVYSSQTNQKICTYFFFKFNLVVAHNRLTLPRCQLFESSGKKINSCQQVLKNEYSYSDSEVGPKNLSETLQN